MSRKKTIYIKKSDVLDYAESKQDWSTVFYISELPAEDVRPVKHGRWISIDNGKYFKCLKCKFKVDRNIYPYCANCGATMDLKEGENNGD